MRQAFVLTLRCANVDSDHFLVASKVGTRLCAYSNTCKSVQRRFDVQKLRSQKIAESCSSRLSELLHDAPPDPEVNTQWQNIGNTLHSAAGEKVGYRRKQKSTWFGDECRQAVSGKNDAYQAILKSAATRAVYEKYCEKRREERHLFRRKKPEFVKAECEKIETRGSRNDARKFFQKIKRHV